MTPEIAQAQAEELMAKHGTYATDAVMRGLPGVWFTTPKATVFAVELSQMLVTAHNQGREQAIRNAVIPAVRILNRYRRGESITPGDRVAYDILRRETADYIDRNELPRDAI